MNGYYDNNGVWITTSTSSGGLVPPAYNQYQTMPTPVPCDWRDGELMRLRQELFNKEVALREAYIEIGSLHEQVRGMQAFDKFSEGMASQKKAQP